jgi:hypothetical protein
MSDAVQATLFRHGTSHVDVKLRPSAWFGVVRVWQGGRWPELEKIWYGRLRPWLPWFSIERQAVRAVEYVTQRPLIAADQTVVRRRLRAALRQLAQRQ